jgi:hypothetical protein
MIPSQPYADQKKQHADWRFCGRQPIRERAARCKSAWCRKLRRGSLHSQHRDNQSARQRCTLQARVDQSSRSQALRGGLCRIASASLVSSPEDVPAAFMVLALVRIVLVKARETRWRDARTLCSASRMTSGTQSDSCRDVIS